LQDTTHPESIGIHRNLLLQNLSLRDYLDIARRRKWWIILSGIGLFVCVAIVAWSLPPIYSAETVILVDTSGVPDKYVPSINTGDIAGRLTTLEQQVLSPTRLRKLVEVEGLYPDPQDKTKSEDAVVKRVQKSITVELINPGGGRMSAFRIAFHSRNRREVAPIANQLAQMFIEENLKARVDQAEETTQFLQDQVQNIKRQLDEKDAELRGVESRNILDLPESKPYHIEALANLRSQIATIQDKIQRDERQRDVLQSLLYSGNDAPTVDLGTASGATSNSYDAQIQKLQSHLSELRQRYGPAHPDVRRTESEIEVLKAKAASEPNSQPIVSQTQQIAQSRKQRRNPVLEAQIEKLGEQISEETKSLEPLQSQLAFHEAKLQELPAFQQKISRLREDYESLRAQYGSLLGKEQAAELSHALEVREKGEKFEVLDPAVAPNAPLPRNQVLLSIAGLIGGILAGCVLAGVAEMNDETVRTENEAAQIVGKRVLAGIPHIVSTEESRRRKWKAVAMVTGTFAGSATIGVLLAILSRGLQ